MDLQLSGKTALVTGGSEGIGKGIAIALAKEGVDVAICARRKDVLEATASEMCCRIIPRNWTCHPARELSRAMKSRISRRRWRESWKTTRTAGQRTR